MKIKQSLTALLLFLTTSAFSQGIVFSSGDFDFEVLEYDSEAVQLKALDGTLKGDVVIPDSVTYKGITYAVKEIYNMGNNPSVVSIRIPKTVNSVNGIYNLTGLLNFYVNEDNLNYQSIDGVLVRKYNMQLEEFPLGRTGEYEVPHGIERINTSFHEGVTKLTIPSTVKYINTYVGLHITEFDVAEDNETFSSKDGALCSKDGKTLISYPTANKSVVTIPLGVDSIGAEAFRQSTEIIINNATPPSIGYNSYYGYNTYITGIYVKSENLNSYRANGKYSKYNVFGYDMIKDSLIYAKTAGGEVALVGSYSESANIVIPQTVVDEGNNTYTVTSIGRRTFYQNYNLQEIVFPETLKSIGDSAFYNTNLQELTLPSSLSTIGKHAFWYCYNIRNVYAKCAPIDISEGCFYDHRTLYVPSEYEEQYKTSTGWSNFTIVTSDIIYGDFILKKLTEETVSIIEYKGTEKDIIIPDEITIIDKVYKITTIGNNAFYRKNLTGVKLPKWLEEIGEGAFQWNYNLTSVDLPSSLKTIGANAFYNCNLTSITLPTSLETIGNNAFLYNYNLIVDVNNGIPCSLGNSPFSSYRNLKILVPSYSLGFYKTAANWSLYNNYIYGVDAVTDGLAYRKTDGNTVELTCCLKAFDENKYSSLTIPETVCIDNSDYVVTTIGGNAFYSTYNLNELIIHEKIDSIGSRVFNSNAIIRLENLTPPKTNSQTFYNYPRKVIVPFTALDTYKTTPNWQDLSSRIMAYDLLIDGVAYLKQDETKVSVCGVLSMSESGVLEIPERIKSEDKEYEVSIIGSNAFNSISGQLLTLPQTIDSIASNSNYGNFSLIYLKNTTPPRLGSTSYMHNVYVPNSALDTYYNNKQWVPYDSYKSYIHGTDGIIENDSVIYNINTSTLIAEICKWMKDRSDKIEVPQTVALGGSTYSITSFGKNAFSDFNNIETFVIPESVSTIGDYALPLSLNLTVIAKSLVPPTIGNQYNYNPNQQTLYVKSASYESYTMADVWKDFGNIVAFDDGDDQFYYTKKGNGKASVTGVKDKTSIDLEIPESVVINGETLTVAQIGEGLFMNNRNIQKVKLPNTIEEIGDKAFYGSSLQQITIPASVQKIGERAFAVNCYNYSYSSLNKIQVRAGNENFMDRNEGLLLSKDGKKLWQTTQSGVDLSYSWEYDDDGYRHEVEFNPLDGIELVAPGAFDGCQSIRVKLPTSLTDVDASMLMYMPWLSDIMVDELHQKLVSIDGVLFSKDTTTVVYFPFYKVSYYDYRNYELPEKVRNLGKFAFYNSQFESLTLSDSLEVIADSAFYSQYSYYYPSTLILTNSNIAVASETAFTNNMYQNTILYVPMGTQGEYLATSPWDKFRTVNSAKLAEEDFLLLKDFYEEMGNGEGWYRKWEFGETADETRITRGLKMVDDHVYSIDLSNNGLQGGLSDKLFKLPYLQVLDLSNNQLSCPIDSVLNEEIINNSILKELNISNNQFTGNIGVVGTTLSSLNVLDASYNKLSEVSPMLPIEISELYLNNQRMDTIDFKSLHSADLEKGETIPFSLLFYDHNNRSYSTNRSFKLQNTDDNYWLMKLDVKNGITAVNEWYSGYRLYKRPVNDILKLSSTDNHSAYVVMDFDLGDVNFDTEVDVSDLQLTVNFAVTESSERLFNFTAADIQGDDWVNVQDVVSLVNILLEQDVDMSHFDGARTRSATTEEAEALLIWRGNKLVLKTDHDIAAIDIAIENADKVKWMLNDIEYDYTIKKKERYVRVIHYSMAGKDIMAGETVIAEATGDNLNIVKANLVKKDGRPVRAIATGVATGIGEVSRDNSDFKLYVDASGIKIQASQSMANVKWAVYSMGGTLLGNGISNFMSGLNTLECNLTGESQVVISFSNESINVTKKVSVTK